MPDVVQMPNPAASEAAPTIIFVDSAVDDLSVSTDNRSCRQLATLGLGSVDSVNSPSSKQSHVCLPEV